MNLKLSRDTQEGQRVIPAVALWCLKERRREDERKKEFFTFMFTINNPELCTQKYSAHNWHL